MPAFGLLATLPPNPLGRFPDNFPVSREFAVENSSRRTAPTATRGVAYGLNSGAYLIASSSTSKISVALGGMTPPAPRSP